MTALSQCRRRLCLTLCHQIITRFHGKGKHSLACAAVGEKPAVGGAVYKRRTRGSNISAALRCSAAPRASPWQLQKARVKTKEPSCAFVDSFLMRPLSATPLSSKLSHRWCLHLFQSTCSQNFWAPRSRENSLVKKHNSQVCHVLIYLSKLAVTRLLKNNLSI